MWSHHCHQSRHRLPELLLPAVKQMPREGNFHLHYHLLYAYQSNPNSETRLEARVVPVEPGMAWRRSSSQNPREAPAAVELESVRHIWAAVASARQVRNWRVAEARKLKRSNVHRSRVMSSGEGGERRTARHGLQYRTTRHGLLKVMPHMDDAVGLMRAWLSRSLRRNAPPHGTADT